MLVKSFRKEDFEILVTADEHNPNLTEMTRYIAIRLRDNGEPDYYSRLDQESAIYIYDCWMNEYFGVKNG